MGFAPYGDYWRSLRRISAAHLFSPRRLACSGELRGEIGRRMVAEFAAKMERGDGVGVRQVLHLAALNNVMMSVFGKCYDEFGGGDGGELVALVKEGYELLGIFNWSDHFPFLGWLDLQGVRRRSERLVGKVNVFVGKIVEEHRVRRGKNEVGEDDDSQDFVDVLLDLGKENTLSDSDMIAVLWVSFI